MKHLHILMIALAVGVGVPGTLVRLTGHHPSPPMMALTAGIAILGASFLLLWACDAAQTVLSQALALAIVALVAVAPEYAVDMYFTWQAGVHPESNYAHYAIANMTGANRLLIGVGWSAIAVLYWLRRRRTVRLQADQRTELIFLGLATLYALVIPIKNSLAWYDGVVFLGLYAWYVILAGRRPPSEVEVEGPAESIARLPIGPRWVAIGGLFLVAAGIIVANAEPFCEGLIATGKMFKINEFILVQWLAPIASEAPEFIVSLMFAWRGQAALALGSLLSSKLNQWTLLVGMIPGVFAWSHGSLDHPLPLGPFQMHEILLTAAQSLLAVMLLISLRLTMTGAMLLFGLFIAQLILPPIVGAHPAIFFNLTPDQIHPVFSILYLACTMALFLQRPYKTIQLLKKSRQILTGQPIPRPTPWTPPTQDDPPCEDDLDDDEPLRTPQCDQCKWRRAGKRAAAKAKASRQG